MQILQHAHMQARGSDWMHACVKLEECALACTASAFWSQNSNSRIVKPLVESICGVFLSLFIFHQLISQVCAQLCHQAVLVPVQNFVPRTVIVKVILNVAPMDVVVLALPQVSDVHIIRCITDGHILYWVCYIGPNSQETTTFIQK